MRHWLIAATVFTVALSFGFASKEILIEIGTANGLSLSGRTLSLAAANTNTTGALTDTDWDTFNNKVGTARLISTDGGLLGGGDLSADRVLSCASASATQTGCVDTSAQTFAGQKTFTVAPLPSAAETIDFGSSAAQWKDMYTQRLLADSGTAALPSISFYVDPDTGIYRESTNVLAIATNGGIRAYFDSVGLRMSAGSGLRALSIHQGAQLVFEQIDGTKYISYDGQALTLSGTGFRVTPQALPTCGTVLEGTLLPVAGAGGNATQVCVCSKDGTNYEWVNLMAPADRSGNTTACPGSGAQ